MARYRQEVGGETGDGDWTRWIRATTTPYRIACCDCGLVHDLEFQVVDGQVEFRARRNERSTGQRRRWKRAKAEPGTFEHWVEHG
jgi:hypothetical protein